MLPLQTRLTALDLIGFAAGDERPRQFVHMPESELDQELVSIKVLTLLLLPAHSNLLVLSSSLITLPQLQYITPSIRTDSGQMSGMSSRRLDTLAMDHAMASGLSTLTGI